MGPSALLFPGDYNAVKTAPGWSNLFQRQIEKKIVTVILSQKLP
jgi:hypothetical protein